MSRPEAVEAAMGMTTESRPSRGAGGRPRNLAEADECRILIEAGLEVMGENGFENATVGDILRVAWVSTRAFYRHFPTKDALLLAIWRQQAELVQQDLSRAVSSAGGPVEAIEAWISTFLNLYYDDRRSARVAVLGSAAARRASGFDAEAERTKKLHVGVLADVLRSGAEAAVVSAPDPPYDALTIYGIVTSAVQATLHPHGLRPYGEVRANIERFVWPALGIANPPSHG